MKSIHFPGRFYFVPFLISLSVIIASCSSPRPLQNPTTSATLWVQNAAEYKALTTTVYQSAGRALDAALNDTQLTASVEQQQMEYTELPPAVVLDVDETVLDNSPYQARLIKQNKTYSTDTWNAWVREEKADAIAGALEFTKKAAENGVTVIYLTNREAEVEEATLNNLKALGFPVNEDEDLLLTKNERTDWTSDKINRRTFVAQNYRVLMLFGDNLNDFLPAKDVTQQERQQMIGEYSDWFGTRWFVLPNPVYGSWEQALYDFRDLDEEQVEEQKMQMLDTKN